ncbi:4'-phosphopantetheinyl transferase superfamily [Russula earlei]|uniref:4'-phosphopantetheinyl transferase superfamily n=1 Tax=Russula earlei TaxID=71964 RepID=A0ACC0UG15_9AGAM|nr:4'-phosphopantetheinyl transferase superfamily [Russula earlei]
MMLFQNAMTFLDAPSQERVRRFHHRADACRCLIGRLLPRVLLSEQRGVSAEKIHFATTGAGKPYFASISFTHFVADFGPPPIAFNVSHDNELVAMASAPGEHGPPAFLIGVDVMMVQVPTRGAEEGLTDAEKHLVWGDVPENEALSRFYLIWTIKEAYIKAIGLGLGFEPSRIEYNMQPNTVAVDGEVATGWRFETSEVMVNEKAYRITVAQFVGSGNGSGTVVPLVQGQIVYSGASCFVRKALHQLKELERDDAGNNATRDGK